MPSTPFAPPLACSERSSLPLAPACRREEALAAPARLASSPLSEPRVTVGEEDAPPGELRFPAME
ncbi:unnamed protein product [Urochloa humidicola]